MEGRKERYQFTWPDKKKSIVLANAPSTKALRLEREKSVGRDGTEGSIDTENIYIEGDNLDALKLLRETYLGQVKMIYIDPPYNTGSDAFVYDDDFAVSGEEFAENSGAVDENGNRLFDLRVNNESNGRLHTDWLNMIYPRLQLARDLLADDGVIFISIDDHEQENLKKICDEIFEARNFAATFLWTKTNTPPALSYKCRKTVEYVFAYEKKGNKFKYFGEPIDGGDVPLLNESNQNKTLLFPAGCIRFNFIENGSIPAGEKEKIILLDDIKIANFRNVNAIRMTGKFKWTQKKLEDEIFNGTYFIVKTNKFSIRFQRVNDETTYKTPTNYIEIEINSSLEVGTNETAKKNLIELNFEEDLFDYTKPYSLIKKLTNMVCHFDKGSTILDFFSGSATTAHAVMQLNAEDGGNRKFIMVQLPEVTAAKSEARKAGYHTICDIGEERIRRAGKKIKEETGADIDYGFRVLRVDSSNMRDVYYRTQDLKQTEIELLTDNIKEDRTPEDLLFQVMLDLGILLSAKIEEKEIAGKKVFMVDDGYLIACFDVDVTEEVVTAIAQENPIYAVFRDSSIASDAVMTNFEQIFKTHSPQTEWKVL